MDLLGLRGISAILALSWGIAYLLFLVTYKSRFKSRLQKMALVTNVELAIYLIVMGVLNWLYLYGVDVAIAFGLAGWLFLFALSATIVVFLVNKSRTA